MAKALNPVRSPRRLYKVANLVRRTDYSGAEPTSTVGAGYIYMKKSIAEFLGTGFDELDADAEDWYFTRTIGGEEVKFRKNLGGYQYKQIHLHSYKGFEITEYVVDPETGVVTEEKNTFKKLTIGLPSGVSMGRFFEVLKASSGYDKIDKIVTHDGKAIFIKPSGTVE